jgi:hypothetical protein
MRMVRCSAGSRSRAGRVPLYLFLIVGLGYTALSRQAEALDFAAVTYNVGTTPTLARDADPNDGYTQTQANISDAWYGNGLAWQPAIDAAMTIPIDCRRPDRQLVRSILSIPIGTQARQICTSIP